VLLSLVHELLKSLREFFLYFFHSLLVVPVEPLLLQVQLVPLQNELLQAVKNILLNQPEITGQLLVMDVFLNLKVKADSLSLNKCTKFL
jgi:uncharacterized membrane protein required for colicin V production